MVGPLVTCHLSFVFLQGRFAATGAAGPQPVINMVTGEGFLNFDSEAGVNYSVRFLHYIFYWGGGGGGGGGGLIVILVGGIPQLRLGGETFLGRGGFGGGPWIPPSVASTRSPWLLLGGLVSGVLKKREVAVHLVLPWVHRWDGMR